MPGMNGIQLAEALDGQYLLMLVSSSRLEKEVAVDKTRTIGKFRRKPLTPAELLEGVRNLFAIPDPI